MALNLKPGLIKNATPYTNPLTARPLFTCKQSPNGLKGVFVQASFQNSPGVSIDFGASFGGSTVPLDQVCAAFVDNSENSHDVNIVVQDSAQVIRVAFGAQKLIPILSGVQSPLIYVMLDDNGNTNDTDVCSIQFLNQYIPEFSSEDFSSVLSYGYGQFFELKPAFTAGRSFNGFDSMVPDIGSILVDGTVAGVFPSRFFVTGLDLTATGSSTVSSACTYQFGIVDDGGNMVQPMWQRTFEMPTGSPITFDLSRTLTGLNMDTAEFGASADQSCFGLGHILKNTAGVVTFNVVFNIFGGQLR